MKVYIVIPAYNEAKFLPLLLTSLISQTILPKKVVVVNDNSTDETSKIVQEFADKNAWLSLLETSSEAKHQPGSKVVQAFNKGFQTLDSDFDVILKLDADLELPTDYLEKIISHLQENPKTGIVGGFAYIQKNDSWVLENLTDKEHVRGALKAYRKACFEAIGGLKPAMGWDTLDELLAQFYGWEVATISSLKVKHLKPTGSTYSKNAAQLQGLAFYRLGYGFWLTFIASLKLALRKKKLGFFMAYMQGFWKAYQKNEILLVTEAQKKYIQTYRWQKIKQKIFG